MTTPGIKYLVWYNNEYRVLSTLFDVAQEATTSGLLRVELKTDYKGNAGEREVREYYSDPLPSTPLGVETTINGYLLPTVLRALATNRRDGYIQGFHLAITAVELFDGSFILHSHPILIGQPNDKGTRYNDLHGASYDSVPPLGWEFGTTGPDIMLDTSGTHVAADKYYSLAKTQAIPHPVSGDQQSPVSDFPWMVSYAALSSVSGDQERALAFTVLGELKYKVSEAIAEIYEPLVKSVCIFLTPEVSQFKFDNPIGSLITGYGALGIQTLQLNPSVKSNAEIIQELFSLPFYKVAEIPFSSLTSTGDWTSIDLKGKLGDSLVTQELLPVDPMSHHAIFAKYQTVYNSRLHLLDYSQLLSRGFPTRYFTQMLGSGQFYLSGGFSVPSNYVEFVEVDIMTDTGLAKTVRYTGDGGMFVSSLGAIVAYPDSRARKITMYRGYDDNGVWKGKTLTFDLKPHPIHNFAYYVNPDLKPIEFTELSAEPAKQVPAEITREQRYENGLKVSQVYNPFTFPLETTYRIGSGRGIALASNSIPLSSGQFGEYPLLVFCSDGIHAQFVGSGDVTYSASKPLARDVCIDANSVKTIDGGTVFLSDRGLMMISGDKVIELSETLEGNIPIYASPGNAGYLSLLHKAMGNTQLVQLSNQISSLTFKEYLAGAVIGYNHHDRELWVTNPGAAHSFIYSKNRWSKITASGIQFINDYPNDLLLTSSGSILSLHEAQNTYTQIAMLSRPVKMGTLKFKQVARAIMRASINTEKYVGLYIFGSYDAEKWAFLGGSEVSGVIRDLGAKVELSDMIYFRFALVGQVSPESVINFLDISMEPRMGNKLR